MKNGLKTAFRDSTTATRPYVLVNPLLAKHLPAAPSQALEYFGVLGRKTSEACTGKAVLVIGFAETATAVGAAVAASIENAVYAHTTREWIPANKLVAEFREEHSHAKNQALYLNDEYRNLRQFDTIVFVEDEITTGKTILNFLKSAGWAGKIVVSALVFNGFNESVFSEYDAAFVCIQRIGEVRAFEFNNYPNPRTGVNISQYINRCRSISAKIAEALDDKDIIDKDVLVIGTEEFMLLALYLGSELESAAKSVKSHSTTRSPLLPGDGADYPIKSRSAFKSVYDNARTTYLYNLEKYDTVIVVTDSEEPDYAELLQVIRSYGNQMIYSVRIRIDE